MRRFILEKIELLDNRTDALAGENNQNCNDLYDAGYRADEVYDIFIQKKFIRVFCEFQFEGYNWMVKTSFK